jgi:hypothetical protein
VWKNDIGVTFPHRGTKHEKEGRLRQHSRR